MVFQPIVGLYSEVINWEGLASPVLPFGAKGYSRSLARLARKYTVYLPLVAGLGFFASLFETAGIGLLIPLVGLAFADTIPSGLPDPMRWLVNELGQLGPYGTVTAIGGIILVLVLLKGTAQAANAALIASIDGRMGHEVRNALAARVLDLEYPFLLRNDNARVVNIMATDSWIVISAFRWFLSAVPAVIGVSIFALALLWVEWRLTLLVLASAVAIRALLHLLESRVRQQSTAVTASTNALVQRMLTIVNAARVVRIYDQQEPEKRKFAITSEQVRKSMLTTQRLTAAISPSVDVLVTALFVAVMLTADWIGLSLAETSAFLVLLSRAEPHAKAISEARIGMASAQGSIDAVDWLLSHQPEPTSPAAALARISLDRPIVFRHVSCAYPDGSHAINNASFTLEPGTATALIGPSGSGKSTLVNLLTLLLEPQFGEICFGDTPVKQIDPRQWRARVAMAGQDADIFDGTVAEMIAFARPGASEPQIEDAARAANAHDFISALPQGYATPVGAPQGTGSADSG